MMENRVFQEGVVGLLSECIADIEDILGSKPTNTLPEEVIAACVKAAAILVEARKCIPVPLSQYWDEQGWSDYPFIPRPRGPQSYNPYTE
jgi:hypothetical protein